MGYVKNNLMDNEELIYLGKVHWFIMIKPLIFFIIGYLLFLIKPSDENMRYFIIVTSVFTMFFSICAFLKAFTAMFTTELAVTSKRVIAKIGFVRRSTIELNHSKVESFKVDQSIIGRIFNYGTVIIIGTGGSPTPIPDVESPLEFRRIAMEAIDKNLK